MDTGRARRGPASPGRVGSAVELGPNWSRVEASSPNCRTARVEAAADVCPPAAGGTAVTREPRSPPTSPPETREARTCRVYGGDPGPCGDEAGPGQTGATPSPARFRLIRASTFAGGATSDQ